MVNPSIIPLLWIATAISHTSALPSRTHCRCTILDASSPSGIISQNPEMVSSPQRPSLHRHRQSSQLSQSDVCHALGPELENFRYTNPKAYSDFIAHSSSTEVWVDPSSPAAAPQSTPTQEEAPLSTTILLQMASRRGMNALGVVASSGQSRRQEPRIRCTTEEVQDFRAYQDSVYTLLALQVIVAFAVLACVVEGVMLTVRWFRNDSEDDDDVDDAPSRSKKPALRLSGAEKRLRAFPSSEPIFSPGVDKKMRSYRSQTWTPSPVYSEKKVFDAWVDEDDEMNRPVM
ncbi:hypothetical protein DM02DRAFT_424769 [Periconia macrospinosa]|uniref:Uncharacterized protein n=1 Tax=Periconia macrospinosa TaxID=97972 RepID=A0A2V1EAZ5_9PLEO|nr:hypothetical protein DM02DRAFT_424769 [Periconia macrospinosa]